MRVWRYGASWEVELDSLADRLIHDTALRQFVSQHPSPPIESFTVNAVEWQRRVRKLAQNRHRTYVEQLEIIIQRATDHVRTATPEGVS
jgi:hypothetical protein